MACIPWHQSLSTRQQAELYALYVLLCNSLLPLPNKQAAFESAADGQHSWPILKVTANALKYIAENGHADLLRRAHETKRADRAKLMFAPGVIMAQTELLEYFFGLDPVTLAVAKSEAGPHGHAHFSEQVDVPPDLFTKSGKGTTIYQPEFTWATKMLQKLQIPFNPFLGRVRKQRPAKTLRTAPLDHLAEDTDGQAI